ncbi:MAG: GTPase Era [Anaerolineae bacterium]|nr:GTPase Era [Anaerolineae bacterium]
MLDHERLPPGHRSGFVAVIGRPNVGKSTLMNAYLGEKVAIVSPKPQTTRLRQLGILTLPEAQIIFVDTPGIHDPRHKLGEFMVGVAIEALADADLILFVVDLAVPPTGEDRQIAALLERQASGVPVLLAMNKLDIVPVERLTENVAAFQELCPDADWTTFSATTGQGRDDLLQRIIGALPEGPRYYPPDQLSDMNLRDIVAEVVREKALLHLHEEVPHSVAVLVSEFKERSENLTYIEATIFVERESQKGILIGSRGSMLRSIGKDARAEIEDLLHTKVYLELWVKVLKNWRKDEDALRRLGYKLPK